MNLLPPRIVRRALIAPLALLLYVSLLAIWPILALGAALHALAFDRKARALRVLSFVAVYLLLEVVSILVMFLLWIASGLGMGMRSGPIQSAHIRYMRWWLRVLNSTAARLFRLRIEIEDRPEPEGGPVLIFSRHAGPGNSLMLVATLMIGYRRVPRIVMLAKLQWEPFFDIIGNRLPNRFIRHDPGQRERSLGAIAELAAGTTGQGAFVLFPEGRDFTLPLRTRAIAYLRRKGHHVQADKAERMRRVLPPRHGGVMAAVRAAPHADVIFVAHTVLEDVGPFGELWRRIPFERPVTARYWRIPASEVPHEQDELIDWLYEWWARIDNWIEERIDPEDKLKVMFPQKGSHGTEPS